MQYDTRTITRDRCTEVISDKKEQLRLDYHRAMVVLTKKTYNQTIGSRLGSVWLVLDPLVLTLVYLFVFSVISHREQPEVIFVGLGLIRGLQRSLISASNPSTLQFQGGFPIERIRTRVTVASSVMILASESFFMGIGISGVLILMGSEPLNSLAYVFLLFFSNLWWHSLGVCLLGITSKIPDLHKFLSYFGMAMFFVSPVLYSFNQTTGIHRELCIYNPATYFIEFSRFVVGTETGIESLSSIGFLSLIFTGVVLFIIGSSKMDSIRWANSNRG